MDSKERKIYIYKSEDEKRYTYQRRLTILIKRKKIYI